MRMQILRAGTLNAYDAQGNLVTGLPSVYAGGTRDLFYSALQLNVPDMLSANDLGGLGVRTCAGPQQFLTATAEQGKSPTTVGELHRPPLAAHGCAARRR